MSWTLSPGSFREASSGAKNAAPTGQGTQSCSRACNRPVSLPRETSCVCILRTGSIPKFKGWGISAALTPRRNAKPSAYVWLLFLISVSFSSFPSDFNRQAPESILGHPSSPSPSSFSVCPSAWGTRKAIRRGKAGRRASFTGARRPPPFSRSRCRFSGRCSPS